MKFKVWNKKEDRPATVAEINNLMEKKVHNQIFLSWAAFPSKHYQGEVTINIDSDSEDEFEIRNT